MFNSISVVPQARPIQRGQGHFRTPQRAPKKQCIRSA